MTEKPADDIDAIAKVVELAGVGALTFLQMGYPLEVALQNLPGVTEQMIRELYPDTDWDFTPVEDDDSHIN